MQDTTSQHECLPADAIKPTEGAGFASVALPQACDADGLAQIVDPEVRSRDLAQGNAEVQRAAMADRLGIEPRLVKPCVALIHGIEEGQREQYAFALAIELVKAGASEDAVLGYLGHFAEHCEQPPVANGRFPLSEAVAQGRKVLRMRDRRRRIRGFGCGVQGHSPLLRFCPYNAPDGRLSCPYIQGIRKAPKRESIAGLVGTFSTLRQLPIPEEWAWSEKGRKLPSQVVSAMVTRRRFLWAWIGALEAAKGHAGREYIGSVDELAYHVGGKRRTIVADLAAMEAAGWIAQTKGSRGDHADMPRKGRVIRRLLPGDALVKEVLGVFPGASVV